MLDILHYSDRSEIEWKSKLYISRLFPEDMPPEIEGIGEEIQHDPSAEVSMVREGSLTMQTSMQAPRREVSASFLPSLPSFGKKKGTHHSPGGDEDLLKRMESEYIKAVDRELPRTILVCPEVGSYPLHMHREYATPLWVDEGENEGMPSNSNVLKSTPLLKRRPKIVSHDVLMIVFSFLPARLPTLISVGHVCRAWRERSEFLCPHWDLVSTDSNANPRLETYYQKQLAAQDPEAHFPADVDGFAVRRDSILAGMDVEAQPPHQRTLSMTSSEAIRAVAESIRAEQEAANADDGNPNVFAPGDSRSDLAASDDERNSVTLISHPSPNEPIAPSTPARVPSVNLFKLRIASRREFIIRRIKENYTIEESIALLHHRRRTLGLFPLLVHALWMIFCAGVAFAMGYLPNKLDTDVKICCAYVFGIAGLSTLPHAIAQMGCCFADSGFGLPSYTPKQLFSGYRLWSAFSCGILFVVIALLGHRLAEADRLLDDLSFAANGMWAAGTYCPSATTGSVPPFPPALDFSPLSIGTSNYTWMSNSPLNISMSYACTSAGADPVGVPGSSTSTTSQTCYKNFTVLVAAFTEAVSTGCNGANPARFIAFDVGTGVSSVVALGNYDPLAYFAGGGDVHIGNTPDHNGIQIKVPRSSQLFPIWDGYYIDAYRDFWYRSSLADIGVNATVTYTWGETPSGSPGGRNHDAAVGLTGMPWGANAIPVVPYFGRGGVWELIDTYKKNHGGTPKTTGLTYEFQSYTDLHDELVVGIWAVLVAAFGGALLMYLSVWCFTIKRLGHHVKRSVIYNGVSKFVRVSLQALVLLACNPIMMMGFGTCYFNDPMPSYCMMSKQSALALFIVGLVFSCCYCVAFCALMIKVLC